MSLIILQDYLRLGGTENHSVLLNDYFNNKGFSSKLVTFRPGGLLSNNLDNYISLQQKDYQIDWFAPNLFKTIKKINPKIIVCMGTIANYYVSILSMYFKHIKVISTVRTGKKMLFLYKYSLKKSFNIIVNCKWWIDKLLLMGISNEKIILHYNPLLIDDYNTPNKEKCKKQYNVNNIFIFLCIQNFRYGKRHDLLINNFYKLTLSSKDNIELWLVGDGPTLTYCKNLVKKLKLENKIKFWGYQLNKKFFYDISDVAISLSSEDSLPNFLIEAQFYCLPVIAFNSKGTSETFLDKQSGFLLKNDDDIVKNFVKVCTSMIINKQKTIEMGIIGHHFVSKIFNKKARLEESLMYFVNLTKNI